MKRTTVYFEAELDARLKREARRQNRPVAELIREAVWRAVGDAPARQPPGAGAFASGRKGTAADTRAALRETGFGRRG
jgi:hypothetical protein